jgi:hypothetical protein
MLFKSKLIMLFEISCVKTILVIAENNIPAFLYMSAFKVTVVKVKVLD